MTNRNIPTVSDINDPRKLDQFDRVRTEEGEVREVRFDHYRGHHVLQPLPEAATDD